MTMDIELESPARLDVDSISVAYNGAPVLKISPSKFRMAREWQ